MPPWGGTTKHEIGDSPFEGGVGGCPCYGLDGTSQTGHPPAPMRRFPPFDRGDFQESWIDGRSRS